jgi:cytochrome c
VTSVSRNLGALACLFAAIATPACAGGKTEREYRSSTGGDAERGEQLLLQNGCGACHTVPGLRRARGKVGPPLDEFARRTYIAGEVPNTPANLVRWVMDPKSIEPRTAMPRLGLTEAEARDVAAFLYTLD